MTPQAVAFRKIEEKRLRPWQNEEEVRLAWLPALEEAAGIHLNAERSKNDSSYNDVIIEFKGPGLFKGSKSSVKFIEATDDRLYKYITRASKKTGIPIEDYIGIAIDGDHICFAQMRKNKLVTEHLLPFSEYSVGLVIEALKARSRRAVTVENLLEDFGHTSKSARFLMQSLADALAESLNHPATSKIKMLFREWQTLYGQVADMSIPQMVALEKELGFTWNGSKEYIISGRLFVIHTYNSLLIKLLAAEIVSAYGLTSISNPAQRMSAISSDEDLIENLSSDIEKAGLFSGAGLKGFVEEAMFSWYLDIDFDTSYGRSIIGALRGVLATLSLYRTDRLSQTRDVLRDLYQGLVPGRLRQSLGEFYTPDWLVDYTIQQAQQGTWISKRVLDPTCGSGAFLLGVMRQKKQEAANAGWSASEILKHLCENVWGFDLNPLAVQTARVNILMEIVDLWHQCPDEQIEIPVLLADAIYSPALNPDGNNKNIEYSIGSSVAGLRVILPVEIAFNRERLEEIFERMSLDVNSGLSYKETEEKMLNSNIINNDEAKEWRKALKETYDQVLRLHEKNWNGIWFRLVKNFFWSATTGKFDVIVGNPPWVRWSKLPELYRERVKPTCLHYGIFSNNPLHGGNELDISAMITYTTADKWLKDHGRLAFVITGTVFKNPSSSGFRNFKIVPKDSSSMYLSPVKVTDMEALKPFSDATNRTVVAVFEKTSGPGMYPVPYEVWDKAVGYKRNIPTNSTLLDVMKQTIQIQKEAMPVGGLGSPWAVLTPGRYNILQKLSGVCSWTEGRKGITTDLNGVFFVPVIEKTKNSVKIRSRPAAGKKDIGPAREAWVEPNLLYPLIKGAGDFDACYLKIESPSYEGEKLYTFLPNTGISSSDYKAAESNMNSSNLLKTRTWFSHYTSLLNSRSTFRRQMPDAPPYAVYNVGDYTLQPWKVIWPEMTSRFYAAVAGSSSVPIVGTRPYVPDHKVYFAAFDEKEPAYFLCGLLNSNIVCEWIGSHNISTQLGNIFKHLRLPKYDSSNKEHSSLSLMVERAHMEHDALERYKIVINIKSAADLLISKWIS